MEGAVSVHHKKEEESQDLLTDSRGGQGPGSWGVGVPSPQVTSQRMGSGTTHTCHLQGDWGGGLTLECLSEKLPQEKRSRRLSDGHPALKFLSKCPDSGCEQGYHTVKRTGSDSERNGCVFRETEVGFSHQPTPPHLH